MEKRKIYMYQSGKGYLCYELGANSPKKQNNGKFGRLVPYGDSEIGEAFTSAYKYEGSITSDLLDDNGLLDANTTVSYIYNIAKVLKTACRQLLDCIDGEPSGRYLYLLNRNASNFFAEMVSNLGIKADVSLETKRLDKKYWDTDRLDKWTYIFCIILTSRGVVGVKVDLFGFLCNRFIRDTKDTKYLIKDFSILDFKGGSFNFSHPIFVNRDWNVVNVYANNNILFPELHVKTEEEIIRERWDKINRLTDDSYDSFYKLDVNENNGIITVTKCKRIIDIATLSVTSINPSDFDKGYDEYFKKEKKLADESDGYYFDPYNAAMSYIVNNGLNIFDNLSNNSDIKKMEL